MGSPQHKDGGASTGLRRAALFASLAGALATAHTRAEVGEAQDTYRVGAAGETIRIVLPEGHATDGRDGDDEESPGGDAPGLGDPSDTEPHAADHADHDEPGWGVDDAGP